MSARSIGSITVAFGLVSIPVKLYSATTEAESIKFNMIAPSGQRVKMQYVDSGTDAVVTKEQIQKGYEFEKGKYVTFAAEELKAMAAVGSHTAEIVEFVPADSVDGVYFDKPYYLSPDKAGANAYALLAKALQATSRVAIGRRSRPMPTTRTPTSTRSPLACVTLSRRR